jgi:hypothetical protein
MMHLLSMNLSLVMVGFGLLLALFFSTGLCTTGFSQTYTTQFEGEENPLSEEGRWQNAGLDWTLVRKIHGLAFGTQTGTNTGAAQYDDSYAHLPGFPPDQEASRKPASQITPGSRAIRVSGSSSMLAEVEAWDPTRTSVLPVSRRRVLEPLTHHER